MKDKIWYVCYGSNLLLERFELYVKGGECRFNKKEYDNPCHDHTMPTKFIPISIPYDMYFAKSSPSWEHKSVAFLDCSKPGKSYGRAYLVTQEQFKDIWRQEGPSDNWYGEPIKLEDIDGIPARTFTNKYFLNDFHDVSESYLEVIKLGLKETYPELNDNEINAYIDKCISNSKT